MIYCLFCQKPWNGHNESDKTLLERLKDSFPHDCKCIHCQKVFDNDKAIEHVEDTIKK